MVFCIHKKKISVVLLRYNRVFFLSEHNGVSAMFGIYTKHSPSRILLAETANMSLVPKKEYTGESG